ncbi:unnamed protein product [Cylicostephanus goldi]|uniref:Uncharacterized protein n=1 Tax=Cylicostephanus goldi TaxID=71465 RepID=A0A3P6TUE5_CYLGO|nr:unnamed protein product [Cylicostephanus goldi]
MKPGNGAKTRIATDNEVLRLSQEVQFFLFVSIFYPAAFLRDRPRGLGLLQLPTGMTDERSAPFFPNLYMAGDKAGEKPVSVPDVHLPGQMAVFTGR